MGTLIHIPETAPCSKRETICFRGGRWQETHFEDLFQWELAAQKQNARLWRYQRAPCFWVQSETFSVVNAETCFARPYFTVPDPASFRDHFQRCALRSVGGPAPPDGPSPLYGTADEADPPRYCSECEEWTRHHDGQCVECAAVQAEETEAPAENDSPALAQATLF